jgi:hypothetical protein
MGTHNFFIKASNHSFVGCSCPRIQIRLESLAGADGESMFRHAEHEGARKCSASFPARLSPCG